MKTILPIILMLLVSYGCATAPRYVDIEGGGKAKQTDYVIPFTSLVIWTITEEIESTIKAVSDFLYGTGKYLTMGGIIAVVVCTTLCLAIRHPVLHTIAATGIIGGGIAFITGIIVCLSSNPWILGALSIAIVLGLIALVYMLYKNKDFSIIERFKKG